LKQLKGHRGIYLLPNLFTTASLFAAFYSMVSSLKQDYEPAVIAIFIGLIADGIDGRVARLTNTQSAFGAEYDSLSDMVTFGVAPSLLMYSWSLQSIGKLGWLVSFMYTASVALRLARFNTQINIADKRYFQGLACPPAAAIMISFIWFCQQMDMSGKILAIVTAIIAFCIASLMVSNIRYYSFKDIDFKGKVPFIYILVMVLIFVAVAANPSIVLFIGFSLYAFSGPLLTLLKLNKVRRKRQRKKNKVDK
jgi:CDP-diacylglycerol---serine O-phosphatidyltransferase